MPCGGANDHTRATREGRAVDHTHKAATGGPDVEATSFVLVHGAHRASHSPCELPARQCECDGRPERHAQCSSMSGNGGAAPGAAPAQPERSSASAAACSDTEWTTAFPRSLFVSRSSTLTSKDTVLAEDERVSVPVIQGNAPTETNVGSSWSSRRAAQQLTLLQDDHDTKQEISRPKRCSTCSALRTVGLGALGRTTAAAAATTCG